MWNAIEIVGAITLAGMGAAALGVMVALGTAARSRRGAWAPVNAFSVFVLDVCYVPLRQISGALGRVAELDAMMVALRNRANERRFTQARRRLLLAPQCMRHLDCPARSTAHGIICERCGRCKLDRILAEAERLGYRVYVLAGSSFIRRLVEEEKPGAALLIACPYECNKVMMALGRLATRAVLLDHDGCVNTDVALSRVLDAMRLGFEDGVSPPRPAGGAPSV